MRKVQADSGQHTYDTGFGMGIGIDMDSGMEDEAADRALNGVARKLDKSLSVEYTVNELITEATDESNLAQMFAGKLGSIHSKLLKWLTNTFQDGVPFAN